MESPVATVLPGGVLPNPALFLCVVAGGAGIPAIGSAALATTAVLASQHKLGIDTVLGVGCVAAVIGGVLGYAIGHRWGASLLERPGRLEEQRRKALASGHNLYQKWGWLACVVIPSYIAGIAGMTFVIFLIFNSIAAVGYQLATGLSAYGASRVASGHSDAKSILSLVVGLGLVALIGWALTRRHRRSKTAGAVSLTS
jgi:membrane-associated protein